MVSAKTGFSVRAVATEHNTLYGIARIARSVGANYFAMAFPFEALLEDAPISRMCFGTAFYYGDERQTRQTLRIYGDNDMPPTLDSFIDRGKKSGPGNPKKRTYLFSEEELRGRLDPGRNGKLGLFISGGRRETAKTLPIIAKVDCSHLAGVKRSARITAGFKHFPTALASLAQTRDAFYQPAATIAERGKIFSGTLYIEETIPKWAKTLSDRVT